MSSRAGRILGRFRIKIWESGGVVSEQIRWEGIKFHRGLLPAVTVADEIRVKVGERKLKFMWLWIPAL